MGMKNIIPNKIFVDTSAFYALMDCSDKYHESATSWTCLLEEESFLLTTNYVALETTALLQSRLGFEAANLWYNDILSILQIQWINEFFQRQAFELWSDSGLRWLSMVDCVSFITMRHHHITKAFCFDEHFTEHGFEVIPNQKT